MVTVACMADATCPITPSIVSVMAASVQYGTLPQNLAQQL